MRSLIIALTLTTVLLSAAAPAFADKDKGRGRGGHDDDRSHHVYEHNDDHYDRYYDDGRVTIRIDLSDRDVISTYLRDDHRKSCPPGLAKKNNGCLPPGQAKKYRIGHPLDVGYDPLPRDLIRLLEPAPRGYMYVQVDKDVLLIGEATKKVIDAVTLMSAVGR